MGIEDRDYFREDAKRREQLVRGLTPLERKPQPQPGGQPGQQREDDFQGKHARVTFVLFLAVVAALIAWWLLKR